MPKQKKIKILNIVGARPNFMKIAPLFREYEKSKQIEPLLVHTNQHFGDKMSGTFFRSLGIKDPDYSLASDTSSSSLLISSIIQNIQPIIEKERPDLMVVAGDVNSTLAAAISANKEGLPLAHVEAGLRSGDRSMPEETNRVLVDRLSDLLFVSEQSGIKNLKKEKFDLSKVYFVGNVMIDNLIYMLPKINQPEICSQIEVEERGYMVITMHRPVNVDRKEKLQNLIRLLQGLAEKTGIKIVFPIHPRTVASLQKHSMMTKLKAVPNLIITDSLDYIEFVKLVKNSLLVLTDSGGIQEEAAYLKIPTITLRESTERPSTIECGTNTLHNMVNLEDLFSLVELKIKKNTSVKNIPLSDGKASERIVSIILKTFQK